MASQSPGLLRRVYDQWVEDQIEEFKESIPRSELLELAEVVIHELRVTNRGQYQITEMLLCDAVDRHIFQLLKLPGFLTWCSTQRMVTLPVEPEPPTLLPMAASM